MVILFLVRGLRGWVSTEWTASISTRNQRISPYFSCDRGLLGTHWYGFPSPINLCLCCGHSFFQCSFPLRYAHWSFSNLTWSPGVLLVSVRISIVTVTYSISYTLLISVTSCRYLGPCDKSHINSLLFFWGKLPVNLPEVLWESSRKFWISWITSDTIERLVGCLAAALNQEGLALMSSAHLPWSVLEYHFGRIEGNIWSAFLSASILVALLGFSHDSVPLLSSEMGT